VPAKLVTSDQKTIDFSLSPRQMQALRWLRDVSVSSVLYGGAKGGGKSVFGCIWAYVRAKELIREFRVPASPTPPTIAFLGRKQSVDFSSTTLQTWFKVVPAAAYTLKTSEKKIIIEDRVALQYGGLDDSDTIRKFNSAEYAFFFVDQAEECSESDIGTLRGTLRLKLGGIQPEYKSLLTANPAICWLKSAYITQPIAGNKFVRALPADNPFLATNYTETLKSAFGFNPQLLNAYLYGSWDELESAFTVIPPSAITRCTNNGYVPATGAGRVTVADIAEDGGDETVIFDFVGRRLDFKTSEIYSHRDLMDTVGRIMAHARMNKSTMICVDKIGLGAGVWSRLNEVYGGDAEGSGGRVEVYGHDGRLSPPGPINGITFKNYRAYAWFRLREEMIEGRMNIPDDTLLREQLSRVTWHYTDGEKIAIDKKSDMKVRLGSSPDRADTLVMGLDALDRVKPRGRPDAYAQPKRKNISWGSV